MKPTTKMAYRLTKSAYLQFLKCPQEFWLDVHEPLLAAKPITLEHEHLRQQGYLVESYVKKLERFQSSSDDVFVDFQRTFQTSDLWARSDVVVADRTTGVIEIFEIKSSSSVKEEHYEDLAFQVVVAERSGAKVKGSYVVILNNEYTRDGEIDAEELFKIEDVTDVIEQKRRDTEDRIWLAFEYLKSFPAVSLADYCTDKKLDCQFIKLHFETFPASTVFDLLFLKHEKRRELLLDILDIVDIPDDFPLSDKQRTQVEIARSGVARMDREKIASILDSFEYPIHFLDYETFAYAVPQFDGVRPFQQMVFQYSLHTIDQPGAEPTHFEFLSRGENDPAREVAAHLRETMGDEIGTVLVWYEAFEKGRNVEMGEMYPEFQPFFEEINRKTFDLMKIFADGHYIHPEFKGRTSIKKVLPVLAPDLDYKALGISEGLSATIKWYRAAKWPSLLDEERETIFNDLVEYCELDTWAMVRIYYELQKVAGIQ